jgi:hypothetical protein
MTFQRKDRTDVRTEFVMPGQANKLDAPERKGYVRRWVTDKPGNIAEMQSYGYAFVVDTFSANKDSSEGSAMDTRISRPAGGGSTYYLMEITVKRNKEIEAYKARQNAEITKAIGVPNSPNIYAPKFNGREQLGVEEETE